MSDILDLREFFVEGGAEEASHVLLHISEPETPEEKKRGYFFAVTEITNGRTPQIRQLQELIDELERRYFSITDEDKDPFEAALGEVNRKGHHILEYDGAEVHCLVGVLRGNQLSFGYHGKPEAALLYARGAEREYMDVVAATDEREERLFSSIMQGAIGSNDIFYVATPHTRELFPADRVQKLLSGRSTKDAADHIEKVLGGLRNGKSYGGIFLHILPAHVAPKTGRQPKYLSTDAAPASIDQKAKATKDILSSSSLLKSPLKLLDAKKRQREHAEGERAATEETNYRPRMPKDSGSLAESILVGLGRSLVSLVRAVIKGSLAFGRAIWKYAIIAILLITNKGGQRQTVWAELKAATEKKKRSFADLPFMSKLLFFLMLGSGLIFVGSMGYLHIRENFEAERVAYENLIRAVRDKKDAAEARGIYGDHDQALTLLKEAEALLATAPKESKEKTAIEAALRSQIEQILFTIQKWTKVNSEQIADLSTAAANPNTTELVGIAGSLFAFGSADTRLFRMNVAAKTIEIIPHDTISALARGSAPKEADRIVFLAGGQSVAELDLASGALAQKDISFASPASAPSDLFVYNQRLYTLDPVEGQIYRHARTQTGYDKGTAWAKSGTAELKDAVSLAIDGDVFVLTKNGRVLLFSAGEHKAFDTAIDPPLETPELIWTYNGVSSLYLLDSAKKRVVALGKDGTLIRQYTDDAWQKPTGMVVDEAKKTVYVLDDNKIYKFGL